MAVRFCKNTNGQVVVGEQQFIRLLSILSKDGIYFGKHLFGKPRFSDTSYFKLLKRNRHAILHLNEEGGVWPGNEEDWKKSLDRAERPSVLSTDDVIATWGRWQQTYNSEREEFKCKIEATGHPRFDLYQNKYTNYFSSEVASLIEKYGNYILINTSFSYANNGEGGVKYIFGHNPGYDPSDMNARSMNFKRWERQMFALSSIISLVNTLSMRFPTKMFIIRPHPSEDLSYYKTIFAGIKNVKVISEGSISKWILGCDLLIHQGCTTGIEATLSKKPVIEYVKNYDEKFDMFLTKMTCVRYDNEEEIISVIENLPKWQQNLEIYESPLAISLLENLTEQDTAKSVLGLMSSMDSQKTNSINKYVYKIFEFAVFKPYLITKALYMLIKGRAQKNKDQKKRFPKMDHSLLKKKINLMALVEDSDVEITSLGQYYFVLSQKKTKI